MVVTTVLQSGGCSSMAMKCKIQALCIMKFNASKSAYSPSAKPFANKNSSQKMIEYD